MRSQIQKEWEKNAACYSIPHLRKVYIRMPAVLKMLGKIAGKRVVDLGCGDGYYSRIMARRGAKVTAVDFSDDSISLAKRAEEKELLGIAYHRSDIARMPFLGSEFFDIALAELVFSTIPTQKKYAQVVKEVRRILKPGGIIVVTKGHPVNFFRPNKSRFYKTSNQRKNYFDSLARQDVRMNIAGRIARFTDYHRTLEDLLWPWLKNGFVINGIGEPKPTKSSANKYPEHLADGLVAPFYIVFRLRKEN